MGSYTNLRIGRLVFTWKNHIPTFLTFLFEDGDFYSKSSPPEDEDDWFEEIGYSTTCKKALAALDRYGYNLEFFAEVYDSFHGDLERGYVDTLEYGFVDHSSRDLTADELERMRDEHLDN